MTRIKNVCQQTGLSEKAIRLYIKEGLINPFTEEGIYRNAYYFSEEDIKQLEDISILRNAGFGINDIRQMQLHPELLPSMIEEKQNLLSAEIYEKKCLQNALYRLSETERGTTKNLAKGLKPAVTHREYPAPALSSQLKYLAFAIISFALLIFILYIRHGGYLVLTFCTSLTAILGAISIFMAFRYLTVQKRFDTMPLSGKGHIAGVIQNGGIDIAFARAGGGTAGTKEPGAGGIWLFLMSFWNEIRPDNWYPIIQYTTQDAEPSIQAATCPYGAFKNTWIEGETIEIAWNPSKPETVFPIQTDWLKKKALLYALTGILLWAIAVWFIFTLKTW